MGSTYIYGNLSQPPISSGLGESCHPCLLKNFDDLDDHLHLRTKCCHWVTASDCRQPSKRTPSRAFLWASHFLTSAFQYLLRYPFLSQCDLATLDGRIDNFVVIFLLPSYTWDSVSEHWDFLIHFNEASRYKSPESDSLKNNFTLRHDASIYPVLADTQEFITLMRWSLHSCSFWKRRTCTWFGSCTIS